MKIVVLGSGAALPSVDRNVSAVGVRHEGRVYLFDCGEGTQRQMMKFGLSYAKVDAIFVTHSHADHIVGIAGLTQTLNMIGRKEPLRIYCPKGAARHIESLLTIGKTSARNSYETTVSEIGPDEVIDGATYTVRSFSVNHTRPSLGYVFEEKGRRNFDEQKARKLGVKGKLFGEIERNGFAFVGGKKITYVAVSTAKKGAKFVYSGDCAPSQETVKAARNADILVHESTYTSDKTKEAGMFLHSTAKQAAVIAKKAKVKKLVLTHLSARYDTNEIPLKEAKSVFENSVVAEDGMSFEI